MNVCAQEGLAPMHVAAMQGFGDMVQTLALLGANVDARSGVSAVGLVNRWRTLSTFAASMLEYCR